MPERSGGTSRVVPAHCFRMGKGGAWSIFETSLKLQLAVVPQVWESFHVSGHRTEAQRRLAAA